MNSNTYHKNWRNDIVKTYITQESQEKSPDVFLETHLPITHIRAETLIGGDSQFITEEEFLEHIVQSSVETGKNRIYLLKGEVGSGKSHLCQWLEYQLNGTATTEPHDEEHVAIHISRNNTRLADILDKLYEHIDKEHEEIEDIAEYDDYPEFADTLLQMLSYFDADLTFDDPQFDFEEFIATSDTGLDLREALIENLEEYKRAVETEEKEQDWDDLLTREQFGEICLTKFGHGFGGDRGDDIYGEVRSTITDRIARNIGIENFQQDLEEISEQYQEEGKRPVLICEDVTTFSVLKDDLLDHIFELGDGSDLDHGYDVVLGYTTGWEREKADDALTTGDLSFMRERAQGYLTLTDRSGQAYFLQQGSMPVRIVDRYLEVIKERSDIEAPDSIDEEVFDGMYPFNKRFVVRAYRNLQEDGDTQRTPRLLLYHVVGDALLSDVPPFRRTEDNTHLNDEFAAPMSVHGLSSAFQQLVKWYGRMDDGTVVLDIEIAETFDVAIPDNVTVEEGEVRLDAMYGSSTWDISEQELEGKEPEEFLDDPEATWTDEENETTESGQDSGTDSPVIDRKDDDDDDENERMKRIGQFQKWYGTGDKFPSSERLTEGVQAALKRFYDPTRLANEHSTVTGKYGFYYTRGSDVPVTIIGPDERKSVSVDVHFADDHEQLYLDLFQYGLDDEFPAEANFDRIRGWCDDKVLELRNQMRDELESCLPDDDELPRFDLETLLVLTQLFIHNARNGQTELGREEVFSVPTLAQSSPFRPDESRFDISSGLSEGFEALNLRRSDIKSLCEGFFLLKENFVDDDQLSEALRNVTEHLDAYVDAAARISASGLPKAYRIGSSRTDASGSTQVNSFFTTVSDYANELQKLARDFDGGAIEEDIESVQSLHSFDHTAGDLLDFYQRLEDSFGPLDASLESDWTDVGEDLKNGSLTLNLSDFGQTLREFEDVDPDNGFEAIAMMHEYNRSRQTQDAWTVYEVLGEMIERIEAHDDAKGSQFTDEITETVEFTAFQNQRQQTIEVLEEI